MNKDKKPLISIIIPAFNSSEIIQVLIDSIKNALMEYDGNYEIIYVLDGCTDNSFEVLQSISKKMEWVKSLNLSRNFGHQAAISAGLKYASGEIIVIMDDDMEDPPVIIPKMISKLNEGFDIVYGIRKGRKRSIFYKLLFKCWYRILNSLTDITMPYDSGDFSVLSRKVVDSLNTMPERNRYLRGMRSWLGYNSIGVEYERGTRFSGETGYSFVKYILFGLDGIFSFSYKPLIYISLGGISLSFFSMMYGFSLITLKLFSLISNVPGWTSLMVVIIFFGGLQLFSIGIIGLYVSRVYDEAKKRPHFIISRYLGFNND